MLFCFALSLSACGKEKPELDIALAAERLEEEGYSVELENDPDDPDQAGLVIALAAYDDDEFLIMAECENTKVAKLMYKMFKDLMDFAEREVKREIEYYEDLLDELEDELSSTEIDDIEDTIKDLKKQLKTIEEDYAVGRDGKIVWYGTTDAIKDSK